MQLVDVLLGPAQDWQRDALCAEYGDRADDWFPSTGESLAPARSVCARCLVRAECLAWALAQSPPIPGIWGGLSERERKDRRAGHGGDVTTTAAA